MAGKEVVLRVTVTKMLCHKINKTLNRHEVRMKSEGNTVMAWGVRG